MNYEGNELVEVTKEQIFDRPKMMLVWDEPYGIPVHCEVCAIVSRASEYRVICKNSTWKHCADIPELKLATQRELSRWLAQGHGELRFEDTSKTCYTSFLCQLDHSNEPVPSRYLVRKWSETEWHSPTRKYLGLED